MVIKKGRCILMSQDGIEISIKPGLDKESSSVTAVGSVRHIITKKEMKNFGVERDQLKKSVGNFFGQAPKDVFLYSPTPWGDLFRKFGGDETSTVLKVKDAKVIDITSKPVVISSQTFKNDSSSHATFDCAIKDSVSETVESSWSSSNKIEASQAINYTVGFPGGDAGGETKIAYSHSWGEETSHSKQIEVGRSSGVHVNLEPGQAVEAIINASRGSMKVEIVYEAKLSGSFWTNYPNKWKKHHFWRFNIDQVFNTNKIPNSIIVTENILVGFYANSTIDLKDVETQRSLNSVIADNSETLSFTT